MTEDASKPLMPGVISDYKERAPLDSDGRSMLDQPIHCDTKDDVMNKNAVRKSRRSKPASDKASQLERRRCSVKELVLLHAKRIIVFSGSGISVSSGMSTFSDPGGLYEKARKKYALQDGMRLFHYSFFQRRRADAQAFIAGVWAEAVQAKPTASHDAIAALAAQRRLLRHYTMNIDGLHSAAGPKWEPLNPNGLTVEMHGNVNEAVCEECSAVYPMAGPAVRAFRARRDVACTAMKSCKGKLRPRVMFYADEDEDLVTESFDDLLEEDLQTADLVLWVGISFLQSASVEHFRRVRRGMQHANRMDTLQVVVNPDEEAIWNLSTALSNVDDINLKQLIETSDAVLPNIAGDTFTVEEVVKKHRRCDT